MFAPKRRHGRRRPKANTREGENPRFDGFVVSPPPFWDDRRSSGANPKCRKDAAPTKLAPCYPKRRGSVPRCKTLKAAVRPQDINHQKPNAVQNPAGAHSSQNEKGKPQKRL